MEFTKVVGLVVPLSETWLLELNPEPNTLKVNALEFCMETIGSKEVKPREADEEEEDEEEEDDEDEELPPPPHPAATNANPTDSVGREATKRFFKFIRNIEGKRKNITHN